MEGETTIFSKKKGAEHSEDSFEKWKKKTKGRCAEE